MFKIMQFLPQEVCLSCDGCCRFSQEHSIWSPAFLDAEKKLICKNPSYKGMISASQSIKSLPLKDYFICPFFDAENNRCKIYDIRPLECELYPFLINKIGSRIHLAVDLNCRFVRDKLGDKDCQDYVDYLLKFLSRPAVTLAIRKNLRIFKDYTEGRVKNLSALIF